MAMRRFYAGFGMLAVVAGWAAATADIATPAPAGLLDGRQRWFSATATEVRNTATSLSLTLRIDSVGAAKESMVPVAPFNALATSLPEWIPPSVGDVFLLKTSLERPDCGGSFPYEHDRSDILLMRHIVAQTFLEGDSIVPRGSAGGLAAAFARQRSRIVHALALSGLDDDAFSLLSALLVGADEDLSPAVRDNFRVTGAAHALALSGFHLGIIVMMASMVFFPLRASWHWRRQRILLTLAAVWVYVGLTGFPLSIVRAAIMLSVFSIGRIVGRDTSPLNSLCVALLVILAAKPYSLFSPALQLSACAVAGIIAFAEPLNPLSYKRRRLHRIAAMVTVPVAAILGTLPLSVAMFHTFPLTFLISNVAIMAVLPLIMAGGVAVVAFSLFGVTCWPLDTLVNATVELLDRFISMVATLPFASVSVYPSVPQCVILALAVVLLAVAANAGIGTSSKIRRLGLVSAVGASICGLTLPAMADTVPESECFIMNMSGTTPMVLRDGRRIVVAPSNHPRHLEATSRRILSSLSSYIDATRADTVLITQNDFDLGRFSRRGDVFDIAGKRVAIVWHRPSATDTATHVDYAVVCSRYTGSGAELAKAWQADTVAISRDVSPSKERAISDSCTCPTISLRDRFLRLH